MDNNWLPESKNICDSNTSQHIGSGDVIVKDVTLKHDSDDIMSESEPESKDIYETICQAMPHKYRKLETYLSHRIGLPNG